VNFHKKASTDSRKWADFSLPPIIRLYLNIILPYFPCLLVLRTRELVFVKTFLSLGGRRVLDSKVTFTSQSVGRKISQEEMRRHLTRGSRAKFRLQNSPLNHFHPFKARNGLKLRKLFSLEKVDQIQKPKAYRPQSVIHLELFPTPVAFLFVSGQWKSGEPELMREIPPNGERKGGTF
jgi:hypothetical protein